VDERDTSLAAWKKLAEDRLLAITEMERLIDNGLAAISAYRDTVDDRDTSVAAWKKLAEDRLLAITEMERLIDNGLAAIAMQAEMIEKRDSDAAAVRQRMLDFEFGMFDESTPGK
jgi:hypothetical protein